MAAPTKQKVQVRVPKRSGFDKSFQNILTTKVGTLTPILVDELIPNSKVYLESALSASLPPLVSDTFMRCNLKAEAFFVPMRLLYGGFESWLTGEKVFDQKAGDYVPVQAIAIATDTSDSRFGPGTLGDYLGIKGAPTSEEAVPTELTLNPYPFLAYHRIYDDWYRNTQVQTPLFNKPTYNELMSGVGEDDGLKVSSIPYVTISDFDSSDQGVHYFYFTDSEDMVFPDGKSIFSLRQRNFGMDYFTIASPKEQLGDAKSVSFTVDTSSGAGSFTIASLRAMNSLQQFAERNSLGGLRLQDYVHNNYGASLESGVSQRAIYLGSAEFPIYSKGIYQTTPVEEGSTIAKNPFANSPGAEFGSGNASGNSTLVKDFTAQEPGILMVLVSLVPDVTYSNGINRLMTRYTRADSQVEMANPILQNTGNQPIFKYELNYSEIKNTSSPVFGYTERYADFKYKADELHGLVRDGENLASFALQRTITGSPTISSRFLEIPTNYLDNVTSVDAAVSDYGCWIDSYFKYHVSMPLAEYSIPSLQDPEYEHGVPVDVDIRGSRL